MKTCGLYIHIPFCKKKCLYCDFTSFCNKENLIKPYIKALNKEIILKSLKYKDYNIKSIFIGGGTPTYIHSEYIKELLSIVFNNFNVEKSAEISIEGNPGTFDKEKIKDYYEIGINRLSIGLQAWQDELLIRLGRIHKIGDFIKGYKYAKEVGFKNINIDLIFGLPDQRLEDWMETLKKATDLKPTHLSCYGLIIEENTPFKKLRDEGKLNINENIELQMHHYTKVYLESLGFTHYEISNYAKKGYECRHNLIYWELENYIGFGLSAHSFINNIRYANTDLIEEYIRTLEKGEIPIVEKNNLNSKELMEEYMFLGLRKMEGISKEHFYKKFGKDIEFIYSKALKDLKSKELIEVEDRIKLTPKGLDYGNYVFRAFI